MAVWMDLLLRDFVKYAYISSYQDILENNPSYCDSMA